MDCSWHRSDQPATPWLLPDAVPFAAATLRLQVTLGQQSPVAPREAVRLGPAATLRLLTDGVAAGYRQGPRFARRKPCLQQPTKEAGAFLLHGDTRPQARCWGHSKTQANDGTFGRPDRQAFGPSAQVQEGACRRGVPAADRAERGKTGKGWALYRVLCRFLRSNLGRLGSGGDHCRPEEEGGRGD